ncbi:SCO family protein [Paenibacillus sp. GSMTC-2017]|uniref:SCO family protein n=1 Tax=Paenibacillus sp. GSMTC-2017 TaxID=2794350 RepID=UPI0018D7170A|nr:SCO family protein [Paenibacillus sp. GSMTC-2017]MBH5319192.1 SCO family protein [Paenibacillus sp. GSMTC-2017]
MSFLSKHGFKIAVLALCAVMGIYLLFTYVWKPEKPMPIQQAAPAFEMNDINGNKVSLASTDGKARIVYFYFANCPDVCPPTTFLLSEVQEKLREQGTLGEKAELISITFDPERDTPEVIREFAGRTFAEFEGWHFLRGEEKETIELARNFNVGVKKDEQANSFIHMNIITLVDKNGQVREWINGSDEELTADYIVKQINKLL